MEKAGTAWPPLPPAGRRARSPASQSPPRCRSLECDRQGTPAPLAVATKSASATPRTELQPPRDSACVKHLPDSSAARPLATGVETLADHRPRALGIEDSSTPELDPGIRVNSSVKLSPDACEAHARLQRKPMASLSAIHEIPDRDPPRKPGRTLHPGRRVRTAYRPQIANTRRFHRVRSSNLHPEREAHTAPGNPPVCDRKRTALLPCPSPRASRLPEKR